MHICFLVTSSYNFLKAPLHPKKLCVVLFADSESLRLSTLYVKLVTEQKLVKDIKKRQSRSRFPMHAVMTSHERNSDVTATWHAFCARTAEARARTVNVCFL